MAFDVQPLKTTINEDDARLVRFRRITNRNAVVGPPAVAAAYSLYLIREWPFISADQAKSLVDGVGATVSSPKADNVTYSGTWQVVYVQAYQDNPETSDRSVIIRQVLFLKDSNNPYTVTYEASCLKTVQVAFYWDITRADAIIYIDAINATSVSYGAGWTADYRLFPGEEGLYNLIITYEHALPYDSMSDAPAQLLTSFDSADHTDEQRFMLNQVTPTEPPADSLGIVYDANYRKNNDCTWDVTHTKRSSHPLGPKTVTGGTVGFREDDVVNRNLLAVPVVGEGTLGITKSGRISINDDETIDATVSTRTAKPIGPTPTTTGTQGYTDVENTAVNAVAMPSPGIGAQGVTTNCNPSFNLDGTVNYSQKTRTATLLGPKNITGGTVGFREEDSITKNNYALPVVGEGGLGVTKSGRVALNDDGTMDATVSTRTAKPVGPGSATSGTVGHIDVGTIALNATSMPSPGAGGKGVTNTVDPSYNLDGTINYSQRARTAALVGPGTSIYGTLTEKEELEIARNSYTIPSPGQGPIGVTNRVNIQLNEDATADYFKVKSTAVEITGTGASGSQGTLESETVARNSSTFPNPLQGAQAVTTSFSASFNPDGTVNKTVRTRTAQPLTETGTATNNTFTDAITVAKNQTAAPSPTGSQGVLETFSASLNDDDTVDYTKRTRTATAKDSNPSLAGTRAYEDRTVLSINQTTLLSPGRGAVGTVTSVTGSFNEDGTFDFTRRDRVAYPLGPVTAASGTLGATESTTLAKNLTATPNPGAGAQGITNDLSIQFNADGTFHHRTTNRSAVEVTGFGFSGSILALEKRTATIID